MNITCRLSKRDLRLVTDQTMKVTSLVEVLVLYYSRGGRTETLANAVADGVNSVEGSSAKVKRVDYATADDFIFCDAVAFGSPNYFSYRVG